MILWKPNNGLAVNADGWAVLEEPLYTQKDINAELKRVNKEQGTDFSLYDYRDEYFVECAVDDRGNSYFRLK